MDREVGDRSFPIWLLGDSNPPQWEHSLKTPLDPRHPVRHNILTPILEVVQDRVFREFRKRVDGSSLFIRNAVENPEVKPKGTAAEWGQEVDKEVEFLQKLINVYKPRLLLCFGAFSFEFSRRTLGETPWRAYGYWGARRIGEEFRRRIELFNPECTNLLPLLHRTISGGKFVESHNYFCGYRGANYFEMAGNSIADKLIQYRDLLQIWIDIA